MIYTLTGAPGSGKQDVAEKLRSFLNEGTCADDCFEIAQDLALDLQDTEYREFGFLADYREELQLAVWRATRLYKDQNLILTHSLLDNVAYSGLRLQALLEHDSTNQAEMARWGIVFDASLQMLVDAKNPELPVYLVPYTGDDEDSHDLENALRDVILTLELRYIEVDPEAGVDTWISN